MGATGISVTGKALDGKHRLPAGKLQASALGGGLTVARRVE